MSILNKETIMEFNKTPYENSLISVSEKRISEELVDEITNLQIFKIGDDGKLELTIETIGRNAILEYYPDLSEEEALAQIEEGFRFSQPEIKIDRVIIHDNSVTFFFDYSSIEEMVEDAIPYTIF